MELEKQIFEGKSLSDLLKELYNKQNETDVMVKEELIRLSQFINTPGDAIVIVPMLKNLMDSKLKNDETILKIVQLFKQQSQQSKEHDKEDGLLTENDIAQLFSEVNSRNTEVKQLTNK
jgi:hypothetical protein